MPDTGQVWAITAQGSFLADLCEVYSSSLSQFNETARQRKWHPDCLFLYSQLTSISGGAFAKMSTEDNVGCFLTLTVTNQVFLLFLLLLFFVVVFFCFVLFRSCFQPLQVFLQPHSGSCDILLGTPDDQVISTDGTMDPLWGIVPNIIHEDDEECG